MLILVFQVLKSLVVRSTAYSVGRLAFWLSQSGLYATALVVYVVECLSLAERCSDGASEHYYPLHQCAQKMCICGLIQ